MDGALNTCKCHQSCNDVTMYAIELFEAIISHLASNICSCNVVIILYADVRYCASCHLSGNTRTRVYPYISLIPKVHIFNFSAQMKTPLFGFFFLPGWNQVLILPNFCPDHCPSLIYPNFAWMAASGLIYSFFCPDHCSRERRQVLLFHPPTCHHSAPTESQKLVK